MVPFQRWLLPYSRAILLTAHEPTAEELRSSWGGIPAWVALPDPPQAPIPGVNYTTLGRVGEVVEQGMIRHAILDLPWWQWRPRMLLQLHRQGLRWCWGPWGVASTRLLGHVRGGMILARRWLNRQQRGQSIPNAASCQQWLQECPVPGKAVGVAYPTRIMHYMRLCSMGGTERQVALLAGAQRQSGHDVRTVAQMASLGEKKTCHDWFAEAGVPLRVVGKAKVRIPTRLLRKLPGELRDTVKDLLPELLTYRPDVLHCWGDEPNIAGLIAARLAGVPAVVQSSTGLSPHCYSATLQPWMQPWYQAGLQQPNVALACISSFGVKDYASWLHVPPERLDLLRIAVAPQEAPSREAGRSWRKNQGIAADAPVLTGFFRLEPGKRPLLFLEIAAQVKKRVPCLQVLLIGGGSLEPQVREVIRRNGLQETVRLLGQPADAMTPLAASDVLLLVSEAEGTPVSVLEAQLAGCVPIVTDVGGCRETVPSHHASLVHPRDDIAGMVTSLCQLLQDAERRQPLADAGRCFVQQRFSLRRMAADADHLYRRLLRQDQVARSAA
jgi:glycosyltransferase involved in cell wall biosynthesis